MPGLALLRADPPWAVPGGRSGELPPTPAAGSLLFNSRVPVEAEKPRSSLGRAGQPASGARPLRCTPSQVHPSQVHPLDFQESEERASLWSRVCLWSQPPAVCEGDSAYFSSCFSQTLPAFVATSPGKAQGPHLLRKVGPHRMEAGLMISAGDCGCPSEGTMEAEPRALHRPLWGDPWTLLGSGLRGGTEGISQA